jgi:hypothetical protein
VVLSDSKSLLTAAFLTIKSSSRLSHQAATLIACSALAYITLEYVPGMAVAHYHGRKTHDVGRKLLKNHLTGNGAVLAKHAWKHPNLARQTYWDVKNAIREILAGGNTTFMPYFSHRDKVVYSALGAVRYLVKAAAQPQTTS